MLAGVWQRIYEANLRRLREHDRGIELALTLQAYRHLLEASTRAETQPIAANSAANTICWWMSAGFP